jgi:Ca2+-binding RTX toxin-like protein
MRTKSSMAVLAATVLSIPLGAAAAAADGDSTIVALTVGGPQDDTLIGHPYSDTILGRGGDDTISGRGGRDTLVGGSGDDTAADGDGRDLLRLGRGDDRVTAGQPDRLVDGSTVAPAATSSRTSAASIARTS